MLLELGHAGVFEEAVDPHISKDLGIELVNHQTHRLDAAQLVQKGRLGWRHFLTARGAGVREKLSGLYSTLHSSGRRVCQL